MLHKLRALLFLIPEDAAERALWSFGFWRLLALGIEEYQRLVGMARGTFTFGVGFLMECLLAVPGFVNEGSKIRDFVPGNLISVTG